LAVNMACGERRTTRNALRLGMRHYSRTEKRLCEQLKTPNNTHE